MYRPNISGFNDFCCYHTYGEPIYFVNGRLQNGFDLLTPVHYRYNFLFADSLEQIEKAIKENWYMFDVKETTGFYYPNDNMFSGDNCEYHIPGYVLRLKYKYGGLSDYQLEQFINKQRKRAE